MNIFTFVSGFSLRYRRLFAKPPWALEISGDGLQTEAAERDGDPQQGAQQ
jgi:hypothetical protein